jgi:hypothetical protein
LRGLVTAGSNRLLLHRLVPQRLARRGEAGAHRHAGCAQVERSGQAAAVGNAAGGNDRNGRHFIDHSRYQADGAARRARMPAGIAALGNDDVGACICRRLGLLKRLHLADDLAARRLDPFRIGSGIAERQHDGGGLGVQRHIERRRIAIERPLDESDADPRIARFAQLTPDGFLVGIARAQHAETAGIRHRGGQPAAGGRSHRRQEDRVLDAQQAGQRRRYGCHGILPIGRSAR